MQNIAGHQVNKHTSTSQSQAAEGTWVGSVLLCLQGRWRCSSTSLSLCRTAVWGGKEVMRREDSVNRSRGNPLYQRNKIQV